MILSSPPSPPPSQLPSPIYHLHSQSAFSLFSHFPLEIGGGYEGTENALLLEEDLGLVPAQLDGHHIGQQDSGCHLEVNAW